MSAIDTLRDALFGNPPSPVYEPSREGLLAAFSELQRETASLANIQPYATWADLAADPGTAGESAVIYEDAGTHTDPVVGGTVSNTGVFLWSVSPAGWERIADTEALRAKESADAAELAASYAIVDDINRNASMGAGALGNRISVTDTTAMGERAGASVTTAGSNTLIGSIAGREITTGGFNTAIGHLALSGSTNPTYSVAVGYNALTGGGNGVGNVAVGANALADYANPAGGATAVGNNALVQATGVRNTAFGEGAGSRILGGAGNVFLGWGAGSSGSQGQAVNDTIVIGYNVFSDSNGQVVIGDTSQDILKMFGITLARWYATAHNLAIGGAGNSPGSWTGQYCLAIGEGAMANATTAHTSVAVGPYALEAVISGKQNVAVGGAALRFGTTVADSTAVGSGAGEAAVSGVGMTAIGHRALAQATVARNCTGVGDSALWMDQGSTNVAVGYVVAEYKVSGNDGVYLGTAAGRNRLNGDRNILVGAQAGAIASATVDTNTGAGAVNVGDRNVGIGFQVLLEATGSDHVAVGDSAGKGITTGNNNTLVGSGAGADLTTGSSNIVIGKDQEADSNTANDQINVGGRYFHDRIRLLERSADPVEPTEGNSVIWMGDGTGKGDDGDIMIASRAGGVTRWATLFDHSAGAAW